MDTRYKVRPSQVAPAVAPLNEPRTCLVCGKKLRNLQIWNVNLFTLRGAPAHLVADWPVHRKDLEPDGSPRPMYWRHIEDPSTGYGLCRDTGSGPRGTLQGDGLFCATKCAIAFARIAANMGLRLPTVSKKERRDIRKQHKLQVALCPDELCFPKTYPSHTERGE